MKIMKKFLALVVALILVVSCMVPAFAADDITVSVETKTVEPGATVQLVVSVSEASFATYSMKLTYDTSVLTLVSVEKNSANNPGMFFANVNASSSKLGTVSMADAVDTTASGTLFTATFKVADSAADGTYSVALADVSFTSFTSDAQYVELNVSTVNGGITVHTHNYTTQYGYKGADGHADTCSCGAKTTVVAHTPDIPAATETQEQKCSACGYVINPKVDHVHKNNLTKVDAAAASCTADGHEAYYSCSCGKYFKDANAAEEIADLDSVIIKGGHNYGTLVAKVDAIHTATELKAGMNAYYFCDECDTYFTAEKVATTKDALVIAAPTHSYTNKYGYKGADGHADTCSCGAKTTVVAHTPDIPAATETQHQKCSACGYVIAEMTGHIHKNHLTKVEATPASCTADGNKAYYTCSCGKYFEDAAASKEITNLAAWKAGEGKIAGGHNYGTLVAKVDAIHTATELKAGMNAYYFCDECDTYFTAEKVATTKEALVIAAPTHSYTNQYGYRGADGHADTCSCGAKSTVVAHKADIPAATETQHQKCSTCGYVITAMIGHVHKDNLTKVEAKAASCTADGNKEYYTCSCGKYFEDAAATVEITNLDSVIIKGGHNHGTEWKSDKDNHWNECACGDKTNIGAHDDANGDGKCDVCPSNVGAPSVEPQAGNGGKLILWIILLIIILVIAYIYWKKKKSAAKK